jgi:hypothetical protein
MIDDAPLLGALRELGDCLSAVDVPAGVVETFPSLSELQVEFFTTVLEQRPASAVGHRIASCVLSQPTFCLNACPQLEQRNGHGLSSSYMTLSPICNQTP